jgi:protease IV
MGVSIGSFIECKNLRRSVRFWRFFCFFVFIVFLVSYSLLLKGSFKLSRDNVVLMNINGMIFEDTSRNEALLEIANDDKVKALIVNLNSPGGTVVGGETLYNYLKKVSENKYLVVVMKEQAASGAYMAAVAANHIIAHNGTLTGSIGVLLQSFDVSDLLKKVGVKPVIIKSSKLKAVPSPLEPLDSESELFLSELVGDSFDLFKEIVISNRSLKKENYGAIFDGRVLTGRQALKLGLIDEIGDVEYAKEWLYSKGIDKNISYRKVSVKKKIFNFGSLGSVSNLLLNYLAKPLYNSFTF